MELIQILFIGVGVFIGTLIYKLIERGISPHNWHIPHHLDHSLRLGQDYYRLRWIIRLGKKYNRMEKWNYYNPFSGDESERMHRIRRIIEQYSQTL